MDNFFFALHLLVAMAEVTAAAVKKFEDCQSSLSREHDGSVEDMEYAAPESDKGEACMIALIRMCAKAFAQGGDEKSGWFSDWKTYLQCTAEQVLFVRYRGNRFNTMFYLAQCVFYHRTRIIEFLKEIHGPTNLLLKGILHGMGNPVHISACRVIGLLSKCVTSPFWKIVEHTVHILDMNDHYLKLCMYMKDVHAPLFHVPK